MLANVGLMEDNSSAALGKFADSPAIRFSDCSRTGWEDSS